MSAGRQRYYRQVRELRAELGISHTEARERWSEFYAPGGIPIKTIKKLVLAIRASTTCITICPFCRDDIYPPEEGGPDYVCSSCRAHYHLDCFEDELRGKCATLGCSTRRVIRHTERPTRMLPGYHGPSRQTLQETTERLHGNGNRRSARGSGFNLQNALEGVNERLFEPAGFVAGLLLCSILTMFILALISLIP